VEFASQKILSDTDKATSLVKELNNLGVELWLDNEQLRFRAPVGALTGAHRESIRQLRTVVIEILRAPAGGSTDPSADIRWNPTPSQLFILNSPRNFNMSYVLALPGPLDTAAARHAIDQVVRRHSALRTRYAFENGKVAYAITQATGSVALDVFDLEDREPSLRGIEALQIARELHEKRFDYSAGPLIRFGIFRLSRTAFVIHCVVHHSIFDDVSSRIMFSELRLLYEKSVLGVPVDLPVAGDFHDFARKYKAWAAGKESQPHIEYWRRTFKAMRDPFWLPRDHPAKVISEEIHRPQLRSGTSSDVVCRLRDLCQKERTTMFAVVLTSWMVLLSSWSERACVASWVVHHGRTRAEHYQTVGYFANRWLCAVDLPLHLSFRQALCRVKKRYEQAMSHLDVMFAELSPLLGEVAAGQLYDPIVFNYIPAGGDPYTDSTSTDETRSIRTWFNPYGEVRRTMPNALYAIISEEEGGLRWNIMHKSELFKESVIHKVFGRLEGLLAMAAIEPDVPLDNVLEAVDAGGKGLS
jgi:hypothetical protein